MKNVNELNLFKVKTNSYFLSKNLFKKYTVGLSSSLVSCVKANDCLCVKKYKIRIRLIALGIASRDSLVSCVKNDRL